MTLNLHDTDLSNIDPLFNAPHQFPNLHTLNLSYNYDLSIPQILTTKQFPNLKVLDISYIGSSDIELDATNLTAFQLEKLFLFTNPSETTLNNNTIINTFSRSPHVSQLKELYIKSRNITSDTIRELFDPERSMWKNLTHLTISSYLDPSALQAIGGSALLSNLISLTLSGQLRKQSLPQFLNSPFLWTSKLKHLSLSISTFPFGFDELIPTLNAAGIELETLHLSDPPSTFDPFLTAPCLSGLKRFTFFSGPFQRLPSFTPEQFLQLPFLSNLERFPFPLRDLDPNDLVTIFSSPMMSNNLSALDFSRCEYPLQDLIKTICTTRINPDDETSPLKYGKIRELEFYDTEVTDDDVQLIVENLTELTHLKAMNDLLITDKTITTLLATEHADPVYPYTTLPNLTHLDLDGSANTSNGLIQLAQSQLFSQLEYLNVGYCDAERWHEDGQQLPPYLLALLTNSRRSNLKELDLRGFISTSIDLKEMPEIAKHFDHPNCEINF